jgi:predicted phosphodiesterase
MRAKAAEPDFEITVEEPASAGAGQKAQAQRGEPAPIVGRLKRILFVPDCHRPYHDEKVFQLMLRAGAVLKPDLIVVLGDFADFYAVSSHDKNPERAADLKYEVDIVKEGLRQLESLGASHHIYVAGNHEDRLERYLMQRAPALFGTVRIPEVLGLHEAGWEYVPYKGHKKVGKIHVTHDIGTAGINAHKQAMAAYQGSVIIGHTHRMEISVQGNADGPPQIGAMFGWLGDFEKVDYLHLVRAKRDWVHGFGLGFQDESGIVHLQPVPIVNGKCVVLGQLIE